MTGASNRDRGAKAERDVVAYLRVNGWPDARRYFSGDGRQPGDIDAITGIAIEVKDRAVAAWPAWIRQADLEAGSRIPVVVRRERGIRDVGRWPAVLPYVDWLDIVHAGAMSSPLGVLDLSGRRVGDLAVLLAPVDGVEPLAVNVFDSDPEVTVLRFATLIGALRAVGYDEPRTR